ncbi:MAG: hypothetical protein JKX70_07540 [Phycisphaerales bacterium]|nr:hypothetical protein [Phycisphaerales bacterium]
MNSVLDDFDQPIGNVRRRLGTLIHQVCSLFARRPMRVLMLSVAIAVMSGVDLYLTLLFITHTGMNELNPLARAMMDYQSPAVLAVWKMGTVVLSVGILLLIRKQRSAEFGAWVGCLVMGWLMVHWTGYIELSKDLNMETVVAQNQDNPTWIMLSTSVEAGTGIGGTVID